MWQIYCSTVAVVVLIIGLLLLVHDLVARAYNSVMERDGRVILYIRVVPLSFSKVF